MDEIEAQFYCDQHNHPPRTAEDNRKRILGLIRGTDEKK